MNDQNLARGPQLRSGPMITSAGLAGAGALLVLAGFVVGGSHVVAAIRRWAAEMEVPPSELAKQRWVQAKAAASAGTEAWQKAPANRSVRAA